MGDILQSILQLPTVPYNFQVAGKHSESLKGLHLFRNIYQTFVKPGIETGPGDDLKVPGPSALPRLVFQGRYVHGQTGEHGLSVSTGDGADLRHKLKRVASGRGVLLGSAEGPRSRMCAEKILGPTLVLLGEAGLWQCQLMSQPPC